MKTRVYIAAPFQLRSSAIALMTQLEPAGIEVTSTWLRVNDMPDDDSSGRLDLADVARAHALVALNPVGWESRGTGGRHVEFGYALALNLPVFLLGVRSNVFHFLSHVQHCENFESLQAALQPLVHQVVGAGTAAGQPPTKTASA